MVPRSINNFQIIINIPKIVYVDIVLNELFCSAGAEALT